MRGPLGGRWSGRGPCAFSMASRPWSRLEWCEAGFQKRGSVEEVGLVKVADGCGDVEGGHGGDATQRCHAVGALRVDSRRGRRGWRLNRGRWRRS